MMYEGYELYELYGERIRSVRKVWDIRGGSMEDEEEGKMMKEEAISERWTNRLLHWPEFRPQVISDDRQPISVRGKEGWWGADSSF
jgi:hypothetical protein